MHSFVPESTCTSSAFSNTTSCIHRVDEPNHDVLYAAVTYGALRLRRVGAEAVNARAHGAHGVDRPTMMMALAARTIAERGEERDRGSRGVRGGLLEWDGDGAEAPFLGTRRVSRSRRTMGRA